MAVCWNERERQYSLIVLLSREWRQSSRGAIAESERAVSEPQCHMGADSDTVQMHHGTTRLYEEVSVANVGVYKP
jgi:hypothetical protein